LTDKARLALVAIGSAQSRAIALARRLALPLLQPGVDAREIVDFDALVLVAEDGLSVQRTGRDAPGPVGVDFGSPAMRHRRVAGHNELLGRAVGIGKKPGLKVIDATAGLGRDGFVLADLGCEVLLCERELLVVAMLESGLERGRASGDAWLENVLGRVDLWQGDARALTEERIAEFDVLYMDPMFPARSKSAAVKKEMALFQMLLDDRDGAEALLDWSLAQGFARVVVKRPSKAPGLGVAKPSHVIEGRAVRYDVYARRALD
jgi:16S rRNA (guanine1516-N2)-methyltransferase